MKLRNAHLQYVALLTAVVLRVATVPTANVSYLLIALYALLGRAQAIQALALSFVFNMLSPGVAAEATAFSIGRYAVLTGAAMSVLLRSDVLRVMRVSRPVLATLLLGGLIVIHSLVVSPFKDVSVMKALSWTVATSTILSAWAGLSGAARSMVARQVFGGLIAILIVSLPLTVMPLGYLRNGTGFQGVLNHPQAFGPVMGLLGAWAGGRILATSRPSWWLVALFGACLTMVLLSEARTAGIAPIIGILLAAVAGQAIARRRLGDFAPGLRSRRVHLVAGVAFMAVLICGPALSERLGQYLSKRTDSSSLADAYDASRGALIERMWTNIKAHPLRGIGFGIASDPADMMVDRDSVLGLPTGAAIEKGVLPLAVLEELGVLGAIAVMMWIWMLVRRSARVGGIASLAVILTALLLNMGESVLFSPGGLGLLLLILIGWALSERDAQSAATYA